jgi:apolipoprotein N-acyltransferase
VLGVAFGTVWLVAGVWWMFISLHRYGNLPAWMAGLAVLALALALSSYLALAMAAVARWRSGSVWHDAICFSAAWLLAELARTWLFTGFPWLASGYAHVDSPLAVLAPWLGVLGIGAAVAAIGALWSQAASHRGAIAASVAALALAAWAGPPSHSRPGATLSVSLLQTNVPQDEKFVVEQLPNTLRSLAADVASARGQLVIAPETAVPLLPSQLDEVAPGYMAALAEPFRRPGRAAIIGVPLGDYDRGYSNSVVGLTAAASAAAPYRYDKQHLVPFGEFIPTGFRWFTTLLNIPLGDFMRGVRNPPSFAFAGERIAPNICYEDLYGDELALRFVDETSAPTVFANLSNIGWFGDTIAIAQHLNISRMRTLEFQRPMLRATNTGATAIIDHRGNVVASLAPFTRGVLEGQVQGRTGTTPYAWWASRAGLWPYLLLGVLGCLWSALRGRAARPAAV